MDPSGRVKAVEADCVWHICLTDTQRLVEHISSEHDGLKREQCDNKCFIVWSIFNSKLWMVTVNVPQTVGKAKEPEEQQLVFSALMCYGEG